MHMVVLLTFHTGDCVHICAQLKIHVWGMGVAAVLGHQQLQVRGGRHQQRHCFHLHHILAHILTVQPIQYNACGGCKEDMDLASIRYGFGFNNIWIRLQ